LSSTIFVNGVTLTDEDWFNDLNRLHYTILGDPATLAALLSTIGGPTTGDVRLTIKTTADTGWVLMNDTTIGNASSGATGRANADTSALFTLLWTNTADAQCAVSTGRGASAAADYAANKTIALPKALGRALATYGTGSGLTARALALATGSETSGITGQVGANATAGDASGNATQASGTVAVMQPTLFLNTMIKL
jgi:hypothetical protein